MEDEDYKTHNLLSLIKKLWEFPQTVTAANLILSTLFSNQELFSCYLQTFWDLLDFGEQLEECSKQSTEGIQLITDEFYRITRQLDHILPSKYLKFEYEDPILLKTHCFNFLKMKVLQKPEMQKILIEKRFFEQLKISILDGIENTADLLDDLRRWFPYFLSLDSANLVDGKEFVKELLDSFPLSNYLFANYFHWSPIITNEKYVGMSHRLRNAAEWDEEFLRLFTESKPFQSLDWTKTTMPGRSSYQCGYLIVEISKMHKILVESILVNPTFWQLEWTLWLKRALLSGEKNIHTFFSVMKNYSDLHQVKMFITSKEILTLPWKQCLKSIEEESTSVPFKLALDEFEEVLDFISIYNPSIRELIVKQRKNGRNS